MLLRNTSDAPADVWSDGRYIGRVPGESEASLSVVEQVAGVDEDAEALAREPVVVRLVVASKVDDSTIRLNALPVVISDDKEPVVLLGPFFSGELDRVEAEPRIDVPREIDRLAQDRIATMGRHPITRPPRAAETLFGQHGDLKVLGGAIATRHDGRVHMVNSVGMLLVEIEPGSFTSGVRRPISLTRGYLMSATETTRMHHALLHGEQPPPPDEQDLPANGGSWSSAQQFCQAISAAESVGYNLPTEAQWEYACQAGHRGPYSPPGVNIDQIMWHTKNSGGRVHPVASLRPNAFGLFDMHGNVREWCRDWFSFTPPAGVDPAGGEQGTERARRGGAFNIPASWGTCGCRDSFVPDLEFEDHGFRVIVELVDEVGV